MQQTPSFPHTVFRWPGRDKAQVQSLMYVMAAKNKYR